MLKIYHVRGTRSVRPIWLCYELDLPVEIETIDFSPAFRNSSAWRAISPAGKVPAMSDGQLTMFESGAMIDYILERYGEGRLRPVPGSPESAIHHQWCWFSEATLARPLGLHRLLMSKAESGAAIAADGEEKARVCLQVVDRAVADRAFSARVRVRRRRHHDGLFPRTCPEPERSRRSISERPSILGAAQGPRGVQARDERVNSKGRTQ